MYNTPLQQQMARGDAEKTVVVPIPWESILDKTEFLPFTPKSIRQYLTNVVEKMNGYFGFHVNGPNQYQLQVTRKSNSSNQLVSLNLTAYRSRQLFNRKVNCAWLENGKKKQLHRGVIDFWMQAGNRRAIESPVLIGSAKTLNSPVAKWLKQQLHFHDTSPDICEIKFSAVNVRRDVYESFWGASNSPELWTPKMFSTDLYAILPECRPTHRLRRNGKAVVWIPRRDAVAQVLQTREVHTDESLRF